MAQKMTANLLYIAYFRVSTDKQGERGLGIQAQRAAVDHLLRQVSDDLAGTLYQFSIGVSIV